MSSKQVDDQFAADRRIRLRNYLMTLVAAQKGRPEELLKFLGLGAGEKEPTETEKLLFNCAFQKASSLSKVTYNSNDFEEALTKWVVSELPAEIKKCPSSKATAQDISEHYLSLIAIVADVITKDEGVKMVREVSKEVEKTEYEKIQESMEIVRKELAEKCSASIAPLANDVPAGITALLGLIKSKFVSIFQTVAPLKKKNQEAVDGLMAGSKIDSSLINFMSVARVDIAKQILKQFNEHFKDIPDFNSPASVQSLELIMRVFPLIAHTYLKGFHPSHSLTVIHEILKLRDLAITEGPEFIKANLDKIEVLRYTTHTQYIIIKKIFILILYMYLIFLFK